MQFKIGLAPVPASRPKVPRRGKPYYPPRYDDWREAAAAFIRADGEPLDGPVVVFIDVACKLPKKPTRPYPSRGDVDNYAKAAMDAITAAGIWVDDDQVVELTVRKRYAAPGETPHTLIEIEEAA